MEKRKLTLEEKLLKITEKKKRLKLEMAKITKFEKREERKKRVSQLIQIGLAVQQYHGEDNEKTRTKILEFLKSPTLGAWDVDGTSWDLRKDKIYKIGEEISNKEKKSKIKRLYLNFKDVPE
jgi:hypothetical protein